jgi:hypothetical protein
MNALGVVLLVLAASAGGRDASVFLREPKVRAGLERLLGGRKDSFTGTARTQPTAKTLEELLQASEPVEDIGGGFRFVHGCRRHACDEKAFVAVDAEGKRAFVGLLAYFDGGRYTSEGEPFVVSGILHVFGKIRKLSDLPEPVARRVERWKTETVGRRTGRYGARIAETRINR